MRDKREFDSILQAIDGRHPSEYSKLTGDFDFTRFVLHNINVPAFAQEPCDCLFVIHVPQMIAGFPENLFDSPIRRTALEDYLARKMDDSIHRILHADETAAIDSRISIARPGQTILPRSSIILVRDYVEARVTIRLPVHGGVISADEARSIFFDDLPTIVNASLIHCYLNGKELSRFVQLMEDADIIRQDLVKRGLVSFAATGSKLARRANSDQPRCDGPALAVDPDLESELSVSAGSRVRGLAIPAGVTLVIGDAYSGRSDLINGLATGIYNHIPDDGRERVISIPDAVQIVADAARSVQRVDLSPFMIDLPDGSSAKEFSTECASPAEAQMAGVIESIHAGAQALFFDEASSDPAFLSSDSRIASLISATGRRMASLSSLSRQIVDDLRISVVVGACACAADFIPVADTILLMEDYRIRDITKDAKALGISPRTDLPRVQFPASGKPVRWIIPSSIDPGLGLDDAIIRTNGRFILQFGRSVIDLSAVPQLADDHQTMAIGLLLYHAKLHHLDDSRTVADLLDLLDQDLSTEGMDAITRDLRGDLARPRRFEVAAVLNRLNTLRLSPDNGSVSSR
ncbi:MAG: ABC-ATPase domain-containing protein [Kiritimatiellia bacterium]|nr:ABC-ATPase domain-containing protein [Kiritimatiellia bacterium]